ncbi:MAG: geranylgeranylglyceryl/heptaprenylglyceryl phosphate synthase [Paludibacteraceae bacterium]|nr:geranylgeranylglyceryl/heptaprenylglyceryl phosphate synthase [Paludibacteraceae bacterium]
MQKQLAILIDPEKVSLKTNLLVNYMSETPPDYVLVGGSTGSVMEPLIKTLKAKVNAPVVIFPGNVSQISTSADALMFLSLLSGRNPEYLIGSHVKAATMLRSASIKVVPVGYILIDGGKHSAVERVSGTEPIKSTDIEHAVNTAYAGQLLGMQYIYLEAGSGATNPVPLQMISAVKSALSIPLIVGGGIRTPEALQSAYTAGADIVVIGNALESNPELYQQFKK